MSEAHKGRTICERLSMKAVFELNKQKQKQNATETKRIFSTRPPDTDNEQEHHT